MLLLQSLYTNVLFEEAETYNDRDFERPHRMSKSKFENVRL
jgi:hypothetical protein